MFGQLVSGCDVFTITPTQMGVVQDRPPTAAQASGHLYIDLTACVRPAHLQPSTWLIIEIIELDITYFHAHRTAPHRTVPYHFPVVIALHTRHMHTCASFPHSDRCNCTWNSWLVQS